MHPQQYARSSLMQVASSALDFLLIETIPLAQEISTELYGDDGETEAFHRIEKYGFKVGQGLAQVLTRNRPRLEQQLDIVKFVCKELWIALYRKQMDNLKTNHRDTYVLVDNNFEYCSRMSATANTDSPNNLASPYLWFPAGIIRGFLSAMGLECTVKFEVIQLPQVTFQILIES